MPRQKPAEANSKSEYQETTSKNINLICFSYEFALILIRAITLLVDKLHQIRLCNNPSTSYC